MRPLTLIKPKPMIEVLGKPLLHHIIDSLPAEITELVIVIGYKGEVIRRYFGDEFEGRPVTYVHQEKQLGNAHALELCKHLLKSGERFLFMFADDLHSPEAIKRLLAKDIGMMVQEHSDPARFGVVEVDAAGHVLAIEEKPRQPKTNLVAVGVYVLDTRIFNYQASRHENGEYYMTDQIDQLIKEHKFVVEKSEFWHPVGYPHDISSAEDVLVKQGKGKKVKYGTLAILLCGGRGTRLPISAKDTQKVIVDVAGKPIVQYNIDRLKSQGFHRIRLALGHRAEMVIDYLKRSGQNDIEYTIEKEPLGTGGGIKFAMGEEKEPFFALNADLLADFDAPAMVRAGANGTYNVISGIEVPDVSGFGVLECDESKRICAFKEKVAEKIPGFVNAGSYLLIPEDMRDMPEKFSIEYDLFPKLVAAGKVVLHHHRGNYWFDTGTEERLKIVREYFSKSH